MPLHTRTDLASEAHALLDPAVSAARGIIAREETLCSLSVTAVEIVTEQGAQLIGKPIGKYYTLRLPPRFERGAQQFVSAADAAAQLILRCAPARFSSCLVAALGNPDITPDALGSIAASSVLVTRHLKRLCTPGFEKLSSAALCRTGVLGTTGVESAVQLSAFVREIKPDLVLAVDALAGSEPRDLCRTLQVSSAGIAPGSGVGNDRMPLSRDTLGVPVVSVGVPTIIDAAAFGAQAELAGMFVTPRDIDSSVRAAARVIGYGIDLALHPGLTVGDIDLLIG